MTQNIRVSLQATIVYVTGTVNSVPVIWTRVSANDWEAISEKSGSNTYLVELTAVDAAGNSASYSLNLNYGLQLITDRTEQDVIQETDKGYYWITDLNRVGNAVKYLTGLLLSQGVNVETIHKTDWADNAIPTPQQLEQYLQDVRNLKSATDAGELMPEVPSSIDDMGVEEANNIERILELLEYYIFELLKSFFYSNEIACGEV